MWPLIRRGGHRLPWLTAAAVTTPSLTTHPHSAVLQFFIHRSDTHLAVPQVVVKPCKFLCHLDNVPARACRDTCATRRRHACVPDVDLAWIISPARTIFACSTTYTLLPSTPAALFLTALRVNRVLSTRERACVLVLSPSRKHYKLETQERTRPVHTHYQHATHATLSARDTRDACTLYPRSFA